MVEVPEEMPVTIPVPGVTAATAGVELLQVPPGNGCVSVVERPIHVLSPPSISGQVSVTVKLSK
jgi:hypothetical protein